MLCVLVSNGKKMLLKRESIEHTFNTQFKINYYPHVWKIQFHYERKQQQQQQQKKIEEMLSTLSMYIPKKMCVFFLEKNLVRGKFNIIFVNSLENYVLKYHNNLKNS